MDETYRMLGKEHEADLEHEAERWRRAVEVSRQQPAPAAAPTADRRRKPRRFTGEWIVALLVRLAR